jgi:hypothetical protein
VVGLSLENLGSKNFGGILRNQMNVLGLILS